MTALGMTGLHPWDSKVTHDLMRTIPATFVLVDLNYEWWLNGVPDSNIGNGQVYYDTMFRLNAGYKIILSVSAIPNEVVGSFLPMLLNRYANYNIWGVRPVNEQADLGIVATTVAAYRIALPQTRLIGPDYPNDYAPGILDPLVASGTLAQLDVLAMHDYFACPGNGTTPKQPWGEYFHPFEKPYGNYPNLPDRIAWMQSYVPKLRQVFTSEPQVVVTEYGLYSGDVPDAAMAAMVSRTTGVPFILSTPQGPVGVASSNPFNNGVYSPDNSSVVWTDAMKEYLRVMKL